MPDRPYTYRKHNSLARLSVTGFSGHLFFRSLAQFTHGMKEAHGWTLAGRSRSGRMRCGYDGFGLRCRPG